MKETRMEKDIGGILQNLMRTPRFSEAKQKRRRPSSSKLTSLGVVLLEQQAGCYLINMSDVRIFSGLGGFVQLLTSEIIQQSRAHMADVMVKQLIDPQITPELAELGVSHVCVYARSKVARRIGLYPDTFRRKMRMVFDAIQSAKWGGILFPSCFESEAGNEANESSSESPALLFPFHISSGKEGEGCLLLLEHDPEGRFLRITVEDAQESRLYLKRIPHRAITDMDQRRTLDDIGRMAEQIYQGIHRECQNQQDEYAEIPGRQPALFELLISAGLSDIMSIKFRWSIEDSGLILFDREKRFIELLSKTLLLFEDKDIVRVLAEGKLLEMVSGAHHVYLDVSRAGGCLNISLDNRRRAATIDEHLDKLPALKGLVQSGPGDLKNIRILLIHHITSQILGLIKALDLFQCAFVEILFIKYKGVVPEDYLEALFLLPEDRFRFHALQKVESRDLVEGSYILSRQYSTLDGLESLAEVLWQSRLDYFKAMRVAAGCLFFREAAAARRLGQQLLLIEDGGYVAPLINQLCLEGQTTVREALKAFGIPDTLAPECRVDVEELNQPLGTWLENTFPGSVEHTRNGFDQLAQVATAYGKLAFPACSIAVSRLKNIEEARECSAAILHAVESVFHGMGKLVSKRHALVIGCRGNIGRNLMRELSNRITHGSFCGIDITVEDASAPALGSEGSSFLERRTIEKLPENTLLNLDLVIGTVGKSVLRRDVIEKIVLRGFRKSLYFVSGSTKTVEFSDISQWLQGLLDDIEPRIGEIPVRIEMEPVKDPQTGLILGSRARIHFAQPLRHEGRSKEIPFKDLYLLGDLMPINFLYYGVPAEIIDEVLCQLLRVSVGFIRAARENRGLPARLLAVDHQIDVDANLLEGWQA